MEESKLLSRNASQNAILSYLRNEPSPPVSSRGLLNGQVNYGNHVFSILDAKGCSWRKALSPQNARPNNKTESRNRRRRLADLHREARWGLSA